MAGISRSDQRLVRHERLRRKVNGTPARPRLAVFRSLKHVYAQIIDDSRGVTLAFASTCEKDIPPGAKTAEAQEIGRRIAQRANGLDITSVVFDRGGFKYHGRVKAVADSARESGLKF